MPASLEDCLGILFHALSECRNVHFDQAKRALAVALARAVELPEESRVEFRAAFLYSMLLVQSRQAPETVTAEVRSKASNLLDECKASESSELFSVLMFDVLMELGEPRRAILFGERALAMAVEQKSVSIGDWLWKIGLCYARQGLRDHATIAYRGAARIFRNENADPRLPAVLIGLGNSIRKSQPAEAEALYKEAASLWEAKGQMESATPAWSNLGIVCSDQGRFEEAIQYYERVRQVRESSPGTPPVQIGRLYNNLAGCYRKMKRFAEAHQAVERAIKILTPLVPQKPEEVNAIASALGTKGMILAEEGRDPEAVEWFRRACAEFEKQPNPNLESVIEELEHEAAALRRLNCLDEVRSVEDRIESVRKRAAAIPSISHDMDAPVQSTEAALLVELERGIRSGATERDVAELGLCVNEILRERKLGEWWGVVRSPECSTLIYYGTDAQEMYQAIEPTLRTDARFEGARVTIRQRSEQSEIMIPRRMVN